MTLSKDIQHNSIECHYAECHYAECHNHLNIMLNIIMLNVVMMSVVLLGSGPILKSYTRPEKCARANTLAYLSHL